MSSPRAADVDRGIYGVEGDCVVATSPNGNTRLVVARCLNGSWAAHVLWALRAAWVRSLPPKEG